MTSNKITAKAKHEYEKLLTTKTWTKADIQRMTKALNSMRFADPTSERVLFLKDWLQRFNNVDREIKITKEHSDQGINYFRKYCFKVNGDVRKQANENLGYLELEVIKKFKSFRFVGWYVEYNGAGTPWYHLVYRTVSKDNCYFEYTPIHWGAPLILRTGRIT